MATRNIIESDLSGKTDAATITFGLEDTWYEIDLTDEEAKKLSSALKTYMDHGRRSTSKKTVAADKVKQVPDMSPDEREEIRQWAQAQGYEVALYGRIPKKVLRAYDKEHGITNRKI